MRLYLTFENFLQTYKKTDIIYISKGNNLKRKIITSIDNTMYFTECQINVLLTFCVRLNMKRFPSNYIFQLLLHTCHNLISTNSAYFNDTL